MQKDEIITIVSDTINNYLESMSIDNKVHADTKLIGKGSFMQSIDLVNIIIDIESKFRDLGNDISLTSEKAMSSTNSPFLTVETLSDFILNQVK